MKKRVVYSAFLLLVLAMSSSVQLQGAQEALADQEEFPARIVGEQEARELGYQEGYRMGRVTGSFWGQKDYELGLGEDEQHRVPSQASVDSATMPEAMRLTFSMHSADFADARAQANFRVGYRKGYSAGWSDGHQVGYAYAVVE